ncbi:MAG: leucine-rich repeat protein, partial [Muribaculaceae bacterium]|nr:leucine-rich repeat protein [Muribaculaceae bacterium]
FKIEDGYWFITYDNGSTWTKLGRATGENGRDGQNGADGKDGQNGQNGADGKDGADGNDGKDGDSVFSSVREDDNYVYVTLAGSGEEIAIPKNKPFSITFDSEEFTVQPGQTYSLKYTIKGGDAKTQINFYEKNGLKAELTKTSNTTGLLEVTTPSSMTPKSVHELIVMVNDGYDRTLMQTLTFVKGVGRVTNYTTIANSGDTQASITLTTNLNGYTIEIPDEAKSWLSLAPQSRATMRDDEINFTINTNDDTEDRSAVVKVLDLGGVEVENIYVLQHGVSVRTINVDIDGHLSTAISSSDKSKIAYLFVSGTLTSNDYTYISQMEGLKYLDLSEISNTTLPSGSVTGPTVMNQPSPGFSGNFETIIFPKTIKAIPTCCFYNCRKLKGDLIIPDNITSIGDGAFYNCTGLSGNLVIGESVTNIGVNAFSIDGKDNFSTETIRFSKIYCKAVIPPTIYVKSDRGAGSGRTYFVSSFGDYTISGSFAKSVSVPKGCRQSYLNTNWNIIPTIEEVDFDKLGY